MTAAIQLPPAADTVIELISRSDGNPGRDRRRGGRHVPRLVDSQVAADIARARGRIVAFQLSDPAIRLGRPAAPRHAARPRPSRRRADRFQADIGAGAGGGYDGFVKVEILNQDVWDAPPDQTAATVQARFAELLG